MDPIEPWVDRDELRRLADALLTSPPSAPAPVHDDAYGDDFIGYTGAIDAEPGPPAAPPPVPLAEQQARQALATARDIARRGGLLANSAPLPDDSAPPPPPPTAQLTQVAAVSAAGSARTSPSSPFVARLQAYGAWLRESVRARSFFVMDRDGGILIDEVQSPKLQQVARTLAQASRTANRQAGAAAIGNLHVKIAPESILEVVPVTTCYGPLILGILIDQPLSARHVETVARGLQQVIDGHPGAPGW